ncbi:receptor activity-modifying protein 1-like [Pungitius pungitius]|uniref:receptor activity-modifying protein 1-like n=1 Tax=Pungitius pungitius TaxID=134920 RepID=UPI002E15E084
MVSTASLLVLIFIWTGIAAKFVVPPCDQHMFHYGVDRCLSDFNKSMETSGYGDHCPWPAEKGVYNKLMRCVDNLAIVFWCNGHGFLKDTVFYEVHKTYFRLCGQVQDPPLNTLVLLIGPVIIATLLLPVLCANLTTSSTPPL